MDIVKYVSDLFKEGFEIYPKPFRYKMMKRENGFLIIVDLSEYPTIKKSVLKS